VGERGSGREGGWGRIRRRIRSDFANTIFSRDDAAMFLGDWRWRSTRRTSKQASTQKKRSGAREEDGRRAMGGGGPPDGWAAGRQSVAHPDLATRRERGQPARWSAAFLQAGRCSSSSSVRGGGHSASSARNIAKRPGEAKCRWRCTASRTRRGLPLAGGNGGRGTRARAPSGESPVGGRCVPTPHSSHPPFRQIGSCSTPGRLGPPRGSRRRRGATSRARPASALAIGRSSASADTQEGSWSALRHRADGGARSEW